MTVKELIQNVEDLKVHLNEISVYDLDVHTSLDLYYTIAKKFNVVIKELSRFEGVISDEVIKQNNCLQYLMNDGLTEKVIDKINFMVANGDMDKIINDKVLNNINVQLKDKVNKSELARLSSATPIIVDSVSKMTDPSRNYVNSTDGYIYSYNGSIFSSTGIKYQEIGLSQGQVQLSKLENIIKDCFVGEMCNIINNPVSVENGWLHYTSNVIQSDDKRKTLTFNVEGGETIKVTGAVTGNVAILKCYDSNDNVILSIPNSPNSSTVFYNSYEFVIPNNCVKVKYCNFYPPELGLATQVESRFEKIDNLLIKSSKILGNDTEVVEENKILKEQIKELQISNDFAWKDFDGVYITFTFDDNNQDISDIEELFYQKGVPVCLASIPAKLDYLCSNNKKVREVLLTCQNHGGEILAHYHTPLKSSSTDTDYYNTYVKAKKDLESVGLNVSGIITTGGNGYETQNFSKCTDIARSYYKYADLTATHDQTIEQYYNPRFFMNGDKTRCINKINEVVSNGKGWIRFASHGIVNNDTVSLIGEVIDYALANNCKIVTWKQMYEKFKTTKLEKRLIALENK